MEGFVGGRGSEELEVRALVSRKLRLVEMVLTGDII